MEEIPSTPNKKFDPALLAKNKPEVHSAPHHSPYRTRSRKNSTLTEENIAVHNDTPAITQKRVTRLTSQGSDSISATAPIPPIIRRSRSSSSVKSEEISVSASKVKFVSSHENVVLEEDETAIDNQVQTPLVITASDSNDGEVVLLKENEEKIDNEDKTQPATNLNETNNLKVGLVNINRKKTNRIVEKETVVHELLTNHSLHQIDIDTKMPSVNEEHIPNHQLICCHLF